MRTDGRFVDLTERIIYLRAIPVAAMLPTPVLKAIALYLKERTFEKGELLMRMGEPILAMHFLIDGKLGLVRNGREIGTLAPPQSLGFMGILANGDGTYDATALEPTRALELAADAVLELMEDHTPLMHSTLQYLADRLLYEMMELPGEMIGFAADAPLIVGSRSIDLVERIVFLRGLTGFKKTNLNALAALAQQLEEERFPAGTVLWRAGEPSHRAVFIAAGEVRCVREDGEQFRHGPGTAIGGLENLARKPRWYEATVESPLLALTGTGDRLVDLFDDNFSMAMDFIGMLSNALVGILERKAALGQQPLQAKRNVSNLGAVPVGA